jgi:hypothetical protein
MAEATPPSVVQLVPGTALRFERRVWEVVAVETRPEGRRLITLRNKAKGDLLFELGELMSKPGLALVREGISTNLPPQIASKLAGNGEVDRLAHLVACLNEIETGYRSGSELKAKKGEPRPEFNPDTTTMTQRIESMAAETGMGMSTLWRNRTILREQGVAGLVDDRRLREIASDADELDPYLVTAARQITNENRVLSKRSRTQQVEATLLRAAELSAIDGHTLEPYLPYRLQRLLRDLEHGDGQHLSTKSRQSSSARSPKLGDGFHADFYGEQVLFDTWDVDVLCIGDTTGIEMGVVAVIGLDVWSGDPVAYDLYPVDSTAVDLALLIHEMLMPQPWDPSFGWAGQWSYVGVPEQLVINYGEANGIEMASASAKLPVNPTSITVDQGPIYISELANSVLKSLGISVRVARKRTGPDKGPVERMFGTIGTEFAEWYATYRGSHVGERGSGIEALGRPTFSALRREFRRYMLCEYRNTPRDRLRIPEEPTRMFTPHQFADLALTRGGLPLRIPDPSIVIDLLPSHFVTVTNSGVSISNCQYWAPVLSDFIGVISPFNGRARGRHIVNRHPSDPTRAWFFHPDERAWYPLKITNAVRPGGPMQSMADKWVESLLTDRSEDWERIAESADEMRNARRAERLNETYTKAGRRKAKRNQERTIIREGRIDDVLATLPPDSDTSDADSDSMSADLTELEEPFGAPVPRLGWRSYESRTLNVYDEDDEDFDDGSVDMGVDP